MFIAIWNEFHRYNENKLRNVVWLRVIAIKTIQKTHQGQDVNQTTNDKEVVIEFVTARK